MLWQTESCKRPREVADEFASTHFGEPRKVREFRGKTTGRGFEGVFSIVGGVRRYRLLSTTPQLWMVDVIEQV